MDLRPLAIEVAAMLPPRRTPEEAAIYAACEVVLKAYGIRADGATVVALRREALAVRHGLLPGADLTVQKTIDRPVDRLVPPTIPPDGRRVIRKSTPLS